jgi:hypothetical protein
MTRKSAIAANLPFRIGLDEREAAVSMSFSPTFFRQLVDDGLMPKPRVVRGRRAWDVEELTIAFRALPREGASSNDADTWADFE